MKKFIVVAFFFLFVFFFLTTKVLAADMNVTCPMSSNCLISGADPLFTTAADGVWYPGRILTKTINMKNSGDLIREMALRALGTTQEDILKNVMNVSLMSAGGIVIWSGSLADFYKETNINLGIFDPNANLDYNMTISMNSSANDDYQGKQSVFDLTLGFWGDPISTPTPTPTPTAGGGGGGTVLGAGVSAPSCNDTKPAGAPVLLQAIAGTNNVTLIWSEGTGPLSYYLVAFGLTSGSITYGNPDIGGAGTTSYTVSNLSGGTPYYFKVRAGNGCATGDYSNEKAATPTGEFISGTATGFEQGVLGAETPGELGGSEATATATQAGQTGEVAGIETQPFSWWWLIFPGIGLILFFFYLWKR